MNIDDNHVIDAWAAWAQEVGSNPRGNRTSLFLC
jgi:hypothetical protein